MDKKKNYMEEELNKDLALEDLALEDLALEDLALEDLEEDFDIDWEV